MRFFTKLIISILLCVNLCSCSVTFHSSPYTYSETYRTIKYNNRYCHRHTTYRTGFISAYETHTRVRSHVCR